MLQVAFPSRLHTRVEFKKRLNFFILFFFFSFFFKTIMTPLRKEIKTENSALDHLYKELDIYIEELNQKEGLLVNRK